MTPHGIFLEFYHVAFHDQAVVVFIELSIIIQNFKMLGHLPPTVRIDIIKQYGSDTPMRQERVNVLLEGRDYISILNEGSFN